MNAAPVYIDQYNGFNHEILYLLEQTLGAVSSASVAYFERCVEGLSATTGGKGLLNNYPVYADPETGIIMAAVLGACGVALRVPQSSRPAFLQAGAGEYIQVAGSKLGLGSGRGDAWDGWIITDGALHLDDAQRALTQLLPVLAAARVKLIAHKARYPRPFELPQNDPFVAFLNAQPAGRGNSHPDFEDDFFRRVPEAAGIDPAGVSGGWINHWPVLFNRASGLFFGYYDAEYALILKVPEDVCRLALATTNAKGEHTISAFPALGDEWIRCSLRDAQDDPRWLAAAYTYAQP